MSERNNQLKVDKKQVALLGIAGLRDTPNRGNTWGQNGLTAEGLKKKFDALPLHVADKLNGLIDALGLGSVVVSSNGEDVSLATVAEKALSAALALDRLLTGGVLLDLFAGTITANRIEGTALDEYVTKAAAAETIRSALAALVGTAPETLDTLGELASAISDNKDSAATLSKHIGEVESKANTNAYKVDALQKDVAALKAVGPAKDGATFIPKVSDGFLSFTNNGGLPNPDPVYINGKRGVTFIPTIDINDVLSWENDGGLPNPAPRSVRGPGGQDGMSVTIMRVIESGEDGGDNIVEFSTGDAMIVKNGRRGQQGPQGIQGPEGPQGPQGEGFKLYKTYASVAAMNADAANVPLNAFVLIDTGDVGDVDNAKMYRKSESGFSFLADLSGAQGIQGPQGIQGLPGADGKDGDDYVLTDEDRNTIAAIAAKKALPSVTAADDGKFLRVVGGGWGVATVPRAEGVGF